MIAEFKNVSDIIGRFFRGAPLSAAAKAERAANYDAGNWHGGHWQNLLSSPMDARHYVLEDFSAAIRAPSFEDAH
ncbi:MAG: hypothetical protein ACRYG5_12995 [Janthinobacterium lividum]